MPAGVLLIAAAAVLLWRARTRKSSRPQRDAGKPPASSAGPKLNFDPVGSPDLDGLPLVDQGARTAARWVRLLCCFWSGLRVMEPVHKSCNHCNHPTRFRVWGSAGSTLHDVYRPLPATRRAWCGCCMLAAARAGYPQHLLSCTGCHPFPSDLRHDCHWQACF